MPKTVALSESAAIVIDNGLREGMFIYAPKMVAISILYLSQIKFAIWVYSRLGQDFFFNICKLFSRTNILKVIL
jgi:hypothetical protein